MFTMTLIDWMTEIGYDDLNWETKEMFCQLLDRFSWLEESR